MTGAYPRSRGATTQLRRRQIAGRGLSPLARGNLESSCGWSGRIGPIPARAGQPTPSTARRRVLRAYPRSRGATGRGVATARGYKGLSPLARGNRPGVKAVQACRGPIPARAGQPACAPSSAANFRAYPRSRGATDVGDFVTAQGVGLSPLARGNLRSDSARRARFGPIPARAGQPRSWRRCGKKPGAYPRSRGATLLQRSEPRLGGGLSPLARGNHRVGRLHKHAHGPIPARAGQPGWRGARLRCSRAYPRSRGATAARAAALADA